MSDEVSRLGARSSDGERDASVEAVSAPGLGWPRVVVLAAGALFLAGLVALGVGMARGVGQNPTGEIDPNFVVAADFTLPTFDRGSFRLEDHANGPIFLYFWASWCEPCREEAPLIERLWPEYRERGYTFVGVNIIDRETDARAFIEEFGLTFPNVRDEQGAVYLEYGVYGVPESFFLSSGLAIDRKFLGALTEGPFREMLEEIRKP